MQLWKDLIDLLFTAKGKKLIVPRGMNASEWNKLLPGGMFQKLEKEDQHYLSMQSKPGWLMGNLKELENIVADFYYSTDWCSCEMVDE